MRRGGAPNPVKIIFDTDMWSDIDDVFALAMLHTLADRGEVELLAVTSSTDDPWPVALIDAVNHYFGRNEIPVGTVRNGVTGKATVTRFPWLACEQSFPEFLCNLCTDDGQPIFPRRLSDISMAEDAVPLLRRILASASDNSVVAVQVGFSTNFSGLLSSGPDVASPLSGCELVRQKVQFLSIMAGVIAERDGKELEDSRSEFNLVLDVPSAQRLFTEWPTTIIASGVEIGLSMLIPGAAIEGLFAHDPRHPVVAAYHHVDPIYRKPDAAPGLHDHGTFDLTSVLYAVRPDAGYFQLSPPGSIRICDEGSAHFTPLQSGRHHFLQMNDLQRARTLEAMLMLSSQPSIRRGSP